MNMRGIRFEIFVSIIVVFMISMLATSLGWYYSEVRIKREQMIEKSDISLKPIVTLATRNIEGGNIMKLTNADAQDLYKTNGNLLYAHLYGMSAGTPASDFSAAIPPAPVDYTYVYVEGGIKDQMDGLIKRLHQENRFADSDFYLDIESYLLIVHKKLATTNEGTVFAVFSANELQGVWIGVVKNISIVFFPVLLATFFFSTYIGNRLAKPIVETAKQVTGITKSLDLTSRTHVDSKNEVGDLATWFNKFIENLNQMLVFITELTKQVNLSANEISSSVNEQAAIATQQSASITQITATLEELATSSSQVADNSNSVVGISANALHQAERGMESIETLKTKMDDITEDNKQGIKEIVELGRKSKEIGKVMEIINTVADQTKLIAFNAAIEAASAGEAGKRFGVVAVEIRRLADNVMESTNEIEGKIDEIQQAINRLVLTSEKGSTRIQEGSHLAAETLSELGSLVEGAKSTNEAATQISLSTQQQKTATQQVLTALKEIGEGIRQSSVSIKQTTASTRELAQSSNELKNMVAEFKTSKPTAGTAVSKN